MTTARPFAFSFAGSIEQGCSIETIRAQNRWLDRSPDAPQAITWASSADLPPGTECDVLGSLNVMTMPRGWPEIPPAGFRRAGRVVGGNITAWAPLSAAA
jgi:hypothetical protein